MKPRLIKSILAYNGFLKMRQDTIVYPNGHESRYDVLEQRADAVIILGITKDNTFILTEEYRYPVGKPLLGLAGGFLEPGEDPLKAAKRELLEETGFSGTPLLLGSSYPYPGVSAQKLHYVLVKDALKQQEPQQEPGEMIRCTLKTRQELQNIIQSDHPLDGNLLAAFGFYSLL